MTRDPLRCAALAPLLVAVAACVPEGPPTGNEPADPTAAPAPIPPESHDTRSRGAAGDPLLGDPYVDDFERPVPGARWRALGPAWRIEDGQLCAEGAKNRGIWLAYRLPDNVRVELDARSDSPDGDLKLELFGDGARGASHASYDDATSYILIYGGWKNRLHVLARLDEHGEDRMAVATAEGAEDPRQRPVEPGQVYRFRIERRDGRTLSWWVDDVLIHSVVDEEPLAGPGHDHFGFNNWQAHVCFDNLRITPL